VNIRWKYIDVNRTNSTLIQKEHEVTVGSVLPFSRSATFKLDSKLLLIFIFILYWLLTVQM